MPSTTPLKDQPISRYMDLARLISMLDSSKLFFTMHDRLGDDHEGKLGAVDQKAAFGEARLKYPQESETQAFRRWEANEWQAALRTVALSCWYADPVESHAMWQLYGRGVAIESNVGAVMDVIGPPLFAPEVRTVKYADYESRPSTGLKPIEVLSYKRPGFEHEREVRLFLRLPPDVADSLESLRSITRDQDRLVFRGVGRGNLDVRSAGVAVPADLQHVIRTIVISPYARQFERDAIVGLASKYGFGLGRIRQSGLDDDPYADIPTPLPGR